MDLEFDIRQVARELITLYAELDAKKHERPQPKEVRTMRPAPGPQSPGSWLWMARGVDMEQKLREVSMNAFADIQVRLRDDDAKVGNLLERIARNSHAISELPWAEDFADELDDQARQISRWVNPPEAKDMAKRLEPYHRAEVILQRLARAGHHLTRDSLRKTAERSDGAITTEQWGGRTTYRFSEVLNHLEGKGKPC